MKKIAAVLLSLVLVAATCAGCGTKIDPNDPQKLEIYLYNAGYGYEWCEALLDAFQQEDWVKEKYPDLKVNFEKDELQTRAQELMSASKKVNKYEIVMGSSLEGVLTPDSGVENLTESVYNSVVPGEDVLYKDKLIPSFLTSAAYLDKGVQQNGNDKQYYQINWGSGMTGLVYNEDRLTALGFTVPNNRRAGQDHAGRQDFGREKPRLHADDIACDIRRFGILYVFILYLVGAISDRGRVYQLLQRDRQQHDVAFARSLSAAGTVKGHGSFGENHAP